LTTTNPRQANPSKYLSLSLSERERERERERSYKNHYWAFPNDAISKKRGMGAAFS